MSGPSGGSGGAGPGLGERVGLAASLLRESGLAREAGELEKLLSDPALAHFVGLNVYVPNNLEAAFRRLGERGLPKFLVNRATAALRYGDPRRRVSMDRRARRIRADMGFVAHVVAGGSAGDFRPEWVADGVGRGVIRRPRFPPRPSPELAELFGIWTGDGSLSLIRDRRPDRGKTYERVCFTVGSTNAEVLERTKELVARAIGEAEPTTYWHNALYYRWCHTFIVEAFLFYGAVPGRKPETLVRWSVPDWVWEHAEHYITGLAECDGSLRIRPEKGTYALRYSRSVEIPDAPEWLAEEVASYGYRNEFTGFWEAPAGAVSYRPQPPPIIADEERMLRGMGFSVAVRAERFFAKPGERVRVKWMVEAYGLEPLIRWLRRTRPARLAGCLPELEEIAARRGLL